MSQDESVKKEIFLLLEKPSHDSCKNYIRTLMVQLSNEDQNLSYLTKSMQSLSNILKDNNVHPRIKLQSNLLIMYLVSMMHPDVYDCFFEHVYNIFRANCLYYKNDPPATKGEEFFMKSKYFSDNGKKNQMKKIGSSYILFSLETVYVLAKYFPYETEDELTPTKFFKSYEMLLKNGVQFPQQFDFQFYSEVNLAVIEDNLQQIEKDFYSSIITSQIQNKDRVSLQLYSNTQNSDKKGANHKRRSIVKKNSENDKIDEGSSINEIKKKQGENTEKLILLEEQNKKLQRQMEIQRKYFEDQISRNKTTFQENIYKYEKKINLLEGEIEKMKKSQLKQKSSKKAADGNWMQEKVIQELQAKNKALQLKLYNLQENGKKEQKLKFSEHNYSESNYESLELEVSKLKKQNKNLKTKLLSECQQTGQFTKKSINEVLSPKIGHLLVYKDARSNFQPFYSNSSSQIKIRLRKAILREKELLYKDKSLQIGSITKLQSPTSLKLVVVFTNISQKPLFNFKVQFVARDDLSVKVISQAKNYLQITGQTKTQLEVCVNQIDFKCLLSSIRFTMEGNNQKIALIMPVSKLKFAKQVVFTPISDKKLKYIKKIEKIFQPDRKMMPNLHKIKEYFQNSLLEQDKTSHQTYHFKLVFMQTKFYLEIDEIENQFKVKIKYFEDEKLAFAEKLMEEFIFVFAKT